MKSGARTMKLNTLNAIKQRLEDDWKDCEQTGIKPEAVLYSAKRIMDMDITGYQIEETCDHYRNVQRWDKSDESVAEQIFFLIDTERPFRLLAWLEEIEGTETAEKIYKHFEETDDDQDQWGYYSFTFLEED